MNNKVSPLMNFTPEQREEFRLKAQQSRKERVPFTTDEHITYRNRYDDSITITLLEKHEQDNERYKRDLKYLYVYTLNRLRLYFSIDTNNEI